MVSRLTSSGSEDPDRESFVSAPSQTDAQQTRSSAADAAPTKPLPDESFSGESEDDAPVARAAAPADDYRSDEDSDYEDTWGRDSAILVARPAASTMASGRTSSTSDRIDSMSRDVSASSSAVAGGRDSRRDTRRTGASLSSATATMGDGVGDGLGEPRNLQGVSGSASSSAELGGDPNLEEESRREENGVVGKEVDRAAPQKSGKNEKNKGEKGGRKGSSSSNEKTGPPERGARSAERGSQDSPNRSGEQSATKKHASKKKKKRGHGDHDESSPAPTPSAKQNKAAEKKSADFDPPSRHDNRHDNTEPDFPQNPPHDESKQVPNGHPVPHQPGHASAAASSHQPSSDKTHQPGHTSAAASSHQPSSDKTPSKKSASSTAATGSTSPSSNNTPAERTIPSTSPSRSSKNTETTSSQPPRETESEIPSSQPRDEIPSSQPREPRSTEPRSTEPRSSEPRSSALSAVSASSSIPASQYSPSVGRKIWRHTRKHVRQTDEDAEWFRHRNHVFVLTFSGKPVYTRYGDDEALGQFCGVLQVIADRVGFFWRRPGRSRAVCGGGGL